MADVDVADGVPMLAVTAAVGAVMLLFVLVCSIGKREKKDKVAEPDQSKQSAVPTDKSAKKTKYVRPKPQKKASQATFSHSWLAGTLKGHSARVLGFDFSANGKYLISAAEDRSLLLWSVKEFNQKEHKFIRANVELDSATNIKFSPDTKAFLVSLYNENSVRIFKIGKKDDGSVGNIAGVFDFPKKHKADIINIGISSNGKFIMTCGSDTSICIWNLKGEILGTIDTHQMNNSYGAVSPCGRFVASSGFTPDVKVWEVCFDKGGSFSEIKRAFELKGHNSGVFSFSFSNDSSRMASVSKDGSWKLWDTNVQYQKNQDPYLLHTGSWEFPSRSLIALSPDGRTVAIGSESTLSIFSTVSGEEEESFEHVHNSPMTALCFDTNGKYLVSSGDKHIQVFHNVVGYKTTIAELEERERKERKTLNSAVKERIRQQIEEAKTSLQAILGQQRGSEAENNKNCKSI